MNMSRQLETIDMQKLTLFVLKSRDKKTCMEHIFMITFFVTFMEDKHNTNY